MPELPSAERGADRRGQDRRNLERRTPAPPWRRPWAYVGYGVLASLLLVMLMRMFDEDEPELDASDLTTAKAAPAVDTTRSAASTAPMREAMGTGEYERLVAQGEAALGQRVVTVLFCEQVNSIALQKDEAVNASIASLADANKQVPGAECKWGGDNGAPDFLLIVPPDLAPRFAAAPVAQQGFVRRRQVRAELEWVGRSEALALRNVGVLRAVR